MPADRWFGVGSCAGDQERAGARAVDDALIHDDPKLLVVFCSQMSEPERTNQEGLARLALTHPLGLSRRSGEDMAR